MFNINIIDKGKEDYKITFKKMINFIKKRNKNTINEIWIVEHNPCFTLGLNANIKNIINAHNIPIIKTDRGGDVTYHGPGQIVIYFLLNLFKKIIKNKFYLFKFINILENSIIDTLKMYNINSKKKKKPGIYISNGFWKNAKIAFLGLKITKKYYTYHGISLNINMNLKPFEYIYPCGCKNIKIVDIKTLNSKISKKNIKKNFIKKIIYYLNK
ncbi:lipoyl(octanoyl) transferase LipB [Candidatus Zinderia endosymbiont of Aphrophora alni]|uniref:lipoyl(octanoyl) transferase LipB n=1 Tax=Candidatus Zinderia endosymbiont of Aphrophora alni TaxID=3077951 RepID=UPI0030D31495